MEQKINNSLPILKRKIVCNSVEPSGIGIDLQIGI